jgi:thiosulfate/3-mercaptopyruvate sulfurtransferase
MIEPFVDVDFIEHRLTDIVIADVRWYADGRSGHEAYAAGHIPGAIFVDLEWRLTGHGITDGGRHPLPDPGWFSVMMSELGIHDTDTVIAYDDAGGVIAARLVWMLRATGREAAVLNGGMHAWPHALSTERTPRRPPAWPETRPWPESRTISIELVNDALPGAVLIDARPRERYLGAADALDPRAGHIPGAISVPCRENLDADGRLLPAAQLRERFAQAGITDGTDVISYCGSGVTACHNLLAMEHAGLGHGRLFPGSWSQWSRDPTRPVATG